MLEIHTAQPQQLEAVAMALTRVCALHSQSAYSHVFTSHRTHAFIDCFLD